MAGSDEEGHYHARAPANLAEALSVARVHGDREFLVLEGERRSFNDVMNEADAVGAVQYGMRICDEQGTTLPQGCAGEIQARSCANIREYWHRPEDNAEAMRVGWLKTGDIGYLDDDGFLFLADRARDMIIRGGG